MYGADRAVAQFETSSACSQSVAAAFTDRMGMDFAAVHRGMAGFGGGMGTRQLTCGAVTGGVFVLSAAFGTDGPPEPEQKTVVKEKVDAFFAAVEERLGATDCRGLLGCTLTEASEKGLFSSRCPDIVRTCAEEVEKLLEPGA